MVDSGNNVSIDQSTQCDPEVLGLIILK